MERLVARARTPIVVEAAGGLLVPLARAPLSLDQTDAADRPPARAVVTNLDLAERLGLPVVLVGRAGLGTLNHCALSAGALQRRGLRARGHRAQPHRAGGRPERRHQRALGFRADRSHGAGAGRRMSRTPRAAARLLPLIAPLLD